MTQDNVKVSSTASLDSLYHLIGSIEDQDLRNKFHVWVSENIQEMECSYILDALTLKSGNSPEELFKKIQSQNLSRGILDNLEETEIRFESKYPGTRVARSVKILGRIKK